MVKKIVLPVVLLAVAGFFVVSTLSSVQSAGGLGLNPCAPRQANPCAVGQVNPCGAAQVNNPCAPRTGNPCQVR